MPDDWRWHVLASAGTTFLCNNGSLIGIQAGQPSASESDRKGLEAELAKLLAGRL